MIRHLEPYLRMTEVLAEVGQKARARGRTGPPNFIVEMIGLSQKKSKVGFSEVKLHGG